MNIEKRLIELKVMANEWPIGSVVYHRANGDKGIVQEYAVTASEVTIGVDWGQARFTCEYPFALNTIKPPAVEGDEWKEGEHSA